MNGNQPYPPPPSTGTGYPGPPGAYPPPTQGGGVYPPAQQAGYPPGMSPYPPTQGGFAPPPGPYGPGRGPQPGVQVAWMPRPTVANCPPGLEYLTQINQLLVKQKKEVLELITGIETENQYVCLNTMGQTVYNCKEESNFCSRQCCSSDRPFIMHIYDNTGMEVIRIHRPYKYTCLCQCLSCAECCQDELEVQAPLGNVIGYVKQVMNGCDIRYEIRDADRSRILMIHGPSYCHCACFGQDINFRVMSSDGSTEIGRITKQWANVLQEIFTDADNFGVSFPVDLDVRAKATLIGAVFLIDFMFFEENHSDNS